MKAVFTFSSSSSSSFQIKLHVSLSFSRETVMLSGRASFHALEDLFVGWNESFVHRIERNVFSFGIFRL